MVAPAVSDDGTNLIKLLSTLDFKHLGTNGWSPRRQLARIANWREALREACDMIGLSGIRANPSRPTLAKVVELNPTFTVVEADACLQEAFNEWQRENTKLYHVTRNLPRVGISDLSGIVLIH